MVLGKRFFRCFDWINFGLIMALLSLGLLFVFSATYSPEHPISPLFKKQFYWAIIGLVLYFAFSLKDVRKLVDIGYLTYFIIILLLIYTHVAGHVAMGGKRWVNLYFMKFQPSELAKLFLPTFIACYFSTISKVGKIQKNITISFKKSLFPLSILLLSFVLVLKQPDLGTALLILFSGMITLYVAGLDKKIFVIFGLLAVLGAPILWKTLKPYQQQRVLVLLGYGDIRKERYQIEQAKIAVGSGGIIGKGILNGTQNKLAFVPEDHTDFIFSVLSEELGFFGSLLVIFLFLLLFIRILIIILTIIDPTIQILAIGLLAPIMLAVFINIGMVVGILPTVGIALPLFSYGGSNLWVSMAALGWLNNIAIRRFYY
ncbi:TPA: rod shape-determining protein RodA [Candidatus Dependentiae bacterium]|nr:MAG: Rod shape-determining protein RodA [candidate division TM6 bacterium GW2011_GWE2_31_21]KKP53010.1 MAG: Rod shape-determining protein RodA [candidate division TM6 bacterium GW2011_GWF2_33_332]HBS47753.1 rod shape-determining protein RodA [Candidatus Dependentiae bacterium]HBZ73271.1 rod shape-determining protein RodA [Candidatus Dependentiae bacterium]